jgi:hypothetical protein
LQVGVMLQEVSAHTVDAAGKPAFVTTNVLQTLRKVGPAGAVAAALLGAAGRGAAGQSGAGRAP